MLSQGGLPARTEDVLAPLGRGSRSARIGALRRGSTQSGSANKFSHPRLKEGFQSGKEKSDPVE